MRPCWWTTTIRRSNQHELLAAHPGLVATLARRSTMTRRHPAVPRLAALVAAVALFAVSPAVHASPNGRSNNDPGGGGGSEIAGRDRRPFPARIDVPDGFFPEGIEGGRGTSFFVGSLLDGAILRGDFGT